ncbi:MAG: CHAT domain-containing protein, partial [Spirochaetaceae bacterium]|nr:CHAT domain-containing protein [Spirochaetaceae bacterium]
SDEATVEFMWSVYRKVIREGMSFRDAYRKTKEEFRKGIIVSRDKQTDWSHPYYWAAFTMYE